MRLTVIGCAGSYPGPDSPASCYLVEAQHERRTWRILLDLGNGALGVLQQHVDPLDVDAVFLSHLHADHCLDLCGFYVMRKYHPDGHQSRIPVFGPEGTAARMARAYDLPEHPGMTGEFDFHAYPAEGAIELGPFTIEPVAVEHPVPAYALRVHADGRLLVYTGDSGVCDPVERAAEGADLFLAEAAFCDGEDNPEGIHLTGTDVGNMAKRARVGRLVLTHVPAWHELTVAYDEARAVWDGPLDMARVGATYDV